MESVKYNTTETQFLKHLRGIDNHLNRIAHALENLTVRTEYAEPLMCALCKGNQEQTEEAEKEE